MPTSGPCDDTVLALVSPSGAESGSHSQFSSAPCVCVALRLMMSDTCADVTQEASVSRSSFHDSPDTAHIQRS